jgi:hypothetical protein
VLDGLRGVASVLVVIFHLFEAFSGGIPQNQIINHGYLAVDFFFLLSGFVIAYAYDDRWTVMTQWGFYKRRLVRLQPMVIAGTLLGALLFPLQDYSIFPKVASAQFWQIIAVMLVGFTMIPLPGVFDIRGWGKPIRSTARHGRCPMSMWPTSFMPPVCENCRTGRWVCWWGFRLWRWFICWCPGPGAI